LEIHRHHQGELRHQKHLPAVGNQLISRHESDLMFHWLKTKLAQREFAERMRKHMATATGPSLHTGAIAVAMATLEDDLVKKQLSEIRSDQWDTFMMTYECIVMWAILRGFTLAGIPDRVQTGVVTAMRDHFARHAFYVPDQFQKLWDQTQKWMPEFARPSKDGILCPAAAFTQIPHDAGRRLDYIPSLVFQYYVIKTLESMTDIGKFAAQQELQRHEPQLGRVCEETIRTQQCVTPAEADFNGARGFTQPIPKPCMTPVQPDDKLAKIVGDKAIPMTELTKILWIYIRNNRLQDTQDRNIIHADENLKAVVNGKKLVNVAELSDLLSEHVKT
jgi:hypothetical protein